MTTITSPATTNKLHRVRARITKLSDRVERIDTLVLGLALGIAVFGPGLWIALAFTAPYLIVQLTLWLLFRTRTK